MCLNTVTKQYKKPSAKVVKAWKVFNSREDELHFEFRPHKKAWVVPQGAWLKADIDITAPEYGAGFHCFPSKRDAAKWAVPGQKITAVRVRYVTAVGYQRPGKNIKVLVAREMYVPKPRTKKEKP